jgi:signal peptidase II
MLIWLLIIAGVVILDQASKALVMYGLGLDEVGESIPIIKNVFHFTHVRNTGAAFGMLGAENERWIFIVISIIGIIALLVYLWKFRPESKLACAAFSMVIGGGIGNMIDRCFRTDVINGVERNYVFDFIDFCAFPNLWKWTFNVADAFVCVGAGILMVWCVYAFIKELKAEKLKKAQGEAVVVDGDNVSSNENDNSESQIETNEIEESIEENTEETEEK